MSVKDPSGSRAMLYRRRPVAATSASQSANACGAVELLKKMTLSADGVQFTASVQPTHA
jgi:hypothetical protein